MYKDKLGGLVVDYLGIVSDLKEALIDSDAGKGDPALIQDEAATILQEKLEVLDAMMHGFNYAEYFTANTSRKLSIILEAEEHILGIEQGQAKNRFLTAVTAMSQAFALAVPHPSAMEAAPIVAFFQAVKARLVKFSDGTGKISGMSNAELEAKVKQTIDQALVTEQVVDIFDAAGIQKPDISIISDEFMQEMKGYQHKNIALETLKKLLADEIKIRGQRSVTQGKTPSWIC